MSTNDGGSYPLMACDLWNKHYGYQMDCEYIYIYMNTYTYIYIYLCANLHESI